MKFRHLIPASLIILIILSGCSKDKPSEPEQQIEDDPVVSRVEYGGCKTDKQDGKLPEANSDRSCIRYSYDEGTESLELTHINAGFNCCPGEISLDMTIRGDTISIVETESQSWCRCLCLYDLSCRIDNLPPSEYTIRISEPYLAEGDRKIEFAVDLAAQQSGSECFDREHYPWNTGYYSEDPYGYLIDYSGCKAASTGISDVEVPGCLDCVLCYYSDNTLTLRQINAGFNCCFDEILADISIQNDTIRITGRETGQPCDCLCLFDLEFEIRGIEPGVYTVIIEEPHLCDEDEPIVFELKLPCLPNYSHCEARSCYPWESSYSEDNDLRRMEEMEQSISELLESANCRGDGDCIALPYGDKPCGGPVKYVAASRASGEFGLLVPTLFVYNHFHDLVNRRYHYGSDCMFVSRPDVECYRGFCRIVK
jgi:hypothetical protein